MNEWISVKDKEPNIKQQVLCLCARNGELAFEYDLGEIERDGYDLTAYAFSDHYVTHWMPLPDPPKQ